MSIVQRVAKLLDSIEIVFWTLIHEDVARVFDNYKQFSTPARWLFSMLIAPLLVAWALFTAPINAVSRAHYRRQERS